MTLSYYYHSTMPLNLEIEKEAGFPPSIDPVGKNRDFIFFYVRRAKAELLAKSLNDAVLIQSFHFHF